MAFSYTIFTNNLAGMTISGVTKRYTAPPSSLSTASLPASYPRFPGGNTPVITFTGVGGMVAATVELCVVMEPVRQGSNATNFTASIAMLDAIDTALRTNTTYGIDRWTIQQEMVTEGDTSYWHIVARVEGSGTV